MAALDFLERIFPADEPPPPPPLLDQIGVKTAEIIGYISVAIVLIGLIVTLIHMAIGCIRNRSTHEQLSEIRLKLGYYLLIALGFLIAQTLIRSVFDPSFKDIFRLAQLLVIRLVLGFFLHRDENDTLFKRA